MCTHVHAHTHRVTPTPRSWTSKFKMHTLTFSSGLMGFLLRVEFVKRTACLARTNKRLRGLELHASPLLPACPSSQHPWPWSRLWLSPPGSLLWGRHCFPHHTHVCTLMLMHAHTGTLPHHHPPSQPHTHAHSHTLTLAHSQADPSSPTSQSHTHAHALGAHTHHVTLTHSHSHNTPSHTLTYSHTLTIAAPLTLGKSLTLLYPFSLPSVGR